MYAYKHLTTSSMIQGDLVHMVRVGLFLIGRCSVHKLQNTELCQCVWCEERHHALRHCIMPVCS
jgi:hypothetical protein